MLFLRGFIVCLFLSPIMACLIFFFPVNMGLHYAFKTQTITTPFSRFIDAFDYGGTRNGVFFLLFILPALKFKMIRLGRLEKNEKQEKKEDKNEKEKIEKEKDDRRPADGQTKTSRQTVT